MKKVLIVCVLLLVAFLYTESREQDPAEAVRSFYSWYVRALIGGARPLETQRETMRKFVTEQLLDRIDQTPKGRGKLDGDPFLDAQEIDPDWAKNIAVGNYYGGRTTAKLESF